MEDILAGNLKRYSSFKGKKDGDRSSNLPYSNTTLCFKYELKNTENEDFKDQTTNPGNNINTNTHNNNNNTPLNNTNSNISNNNSDEFGSSLKRDLFYSLDQLPLKKGLSSRSLSNHRRSFSRRVHVLTTTICTEEVVLVKGEPRFIEEGDDRGVLKKSSLKSANKTHFSGVKDENKSNFGVKDGNKSSFGMRDRSRSSMRDKGERRIQFKVEDKVFEKGLDELRTEEQFLVYYGMAGITAGKAGEKGVVGNMGGNRGMVSGMGSNRSVVSGMASEKGVVGSSRSGVVGGSDGGGEMRGSGGERSELNSAQKLFMLLNQTNLYQSANNTGADQ